MFTAEIFIQHAEINIIVTYFHTYYGTNLIHRDLPVQGKMIQIQYILYRRYFCTRI